MCAVLHTDTRVKGSSGGARQQQALKMNFKMKYGPGRRRAYLRISCPHKNLAVSKKKGDTHLLLPSFLLPTRQMTSDSAGKRRERVRPCLHRERDPIKKFAPLLLHLTTHTRQRGDDGKKVFFCGKPISFSAGNRAYPGSPLLSLLRSVIVLSLSRVLAFPSPST